MKSLTDKIQEIQDQVTELIYAARDLSMAAAGKYEERPKFKWDGPEIYALRRLRKALKDIGPDWISGQATHDESGISLPHHNDCQCLKGTKQ
jgi:hypothetical protein